MLYSVRSNIIKILKMKNLEMNYKIIHFVSSIKISKDIQISIRICKGSHFIFVLSISSSIRWCILCVFSPSFHHLVFETDNLPLIIDIYWKFVVLSILFWDLLELNTVIDILKRFNNCNYSNTYFFFSIACFVCPFLMKIRDL